MNNVYKMAVANVSRYISKQDIEKGSNTTAFDAAIVLAVAFCKNQNEVLDDIVLEGFGDGHDKMTKICPVRCHWSHVYLDGTSPDTPLSEIVIEKGFTICGYCGETIPEITCRRKKD